MAAVESRTFYCDDCLGCNGALALGACLVIFALLACCSRLCGNVLLPLGPWQLRRVSCYRGRLPAVLCGAGSTSRGAVQGG